MESQFTIRLPADLSRKVKEKAKRLRLKRSDIVRMALTEFLEGPDEDMPVYDRVKHLVGSIKTGIPDLGLNHSKYFLQKLKANHRTRG